MKETFRTIKCLTDKYKISKKGNIISHYFDPPTMLKRQVTKTGYVIANLRGYYKNGKKSVVPVSQLVMETWGTPRPSPQHKITYKNGDSTNVNINNLVWATRAEIMSKTITRIKKTMRKKEKKTIIVVCEGLKNIHNLPRTINKGYLNTGKKQKKCYYIFTPEHFFTWWEENKNVYEKI